MNKSALRAEVRRTLLDTSPTNPRILDATIDEHLLNAAFYIQADLSSVNCVPHTSVQVADLVANEDFYDTPPSLTSPGIRRLYRLSDQGYYIPSTYLSFERWEDEALRREIAGESGGVDGARRTLYTVEGDYYLIYPTPTAALTAGLKVRFASVVTMPTDDSVPQLPLATHPAIWARAASTLGIGLDTPTVKTLVDLADSTVDKYKQGYRHRFGNEPEQIESVGGWDKMANDRMRNINRDRNPDPPRI